jgi:hypothetical protein
MPKAHHSKSSATKALEKATKDWRSAKKRERAARNTLAAIVNEAVASGVMSENKVASVTAIPRMTIRKMLGKDDAAAEATVTDEPIVAAAVEVPAIAAAAEIPVIAAVADVDADVEANESEADESDVTSADQRAEPMLSGADAVPSDTDTEEAPANDAESPASTGTSPETPAWGGAARPSFLA